jgi:phosphonoacetaldehyde hydrolase
MWTIGLTRTGNMIGLDTASWDQLSITRKEALLKQAASEMMSAGAHFVVEDLSACDQVLAQIETRIVDGLAMI